MMAKFTKLVKEPVQLVDPKRSASHTHIRHALNEVVVSYHDLDEEIKGLEKAKQTMRDEFLKLADTYIHDTMVLSQQYVLQEDYNVADLEGWRLVDRDDKGMLLEEDPTLMKFVWECNGCTLTRSFARVGVKFDAEAFRDAEPGLAPTYLETKVTYTLNEKKVQDDMAQHPNLLNIVRAYTSPGSLQVRVSQKRKEVE